MTKIRVYNDATMQLANHLTVLLLTSDQVDCGEPNDQTGCPIGLALRDSDDRLNRLDYEVQPEYIRLPIQLMPPGMHKDGRRKWGRFATTTQLQEMIHTFDQAGVMLTGYIILDWKEREARFMPMRSPEIVEA